VFGSAAWILVTDESVSY